MSEMMKCFVMPGIEMVGVMDKPIPRPIPSDAIIRSYRRAHIHLPHRDSCHRRPPGPDARAP